MAIRLRDLWKGSLSEQLSQMFERAAQIVTGVAGLSYAFGWFLAARFYGQFGSYPEDGGVSFSWLAIRAIFAGIAALIVLIFVRFILAVAKDAAPVRRTLHGKAAQMTVSLLCGALPIIALIAMVAGDVISGNSTNWFIIALLTVCILLILRIAWLIPPPAVAWAIPVNTQLLLRGFAGSVVGFFAVGFVLLPFYLGDHLARDVRNGLPVRLPVAPGINVFEVPLVHISSVGPLPLSSDLTSKSGCIHRLGSDSRTSVFWNAGHVIRVPEWSISVTMEC